MEKMQVLKIMFLAQNTALATNDVNLTYYLNTNNFAGSPTLKHNTFPKNICLKM